MPPCPVLAGWTRRYLCTRTKDEKKILISTPLAEYDHIGAKSLNVNPKRLDAPSAPEVIILCLQAAD